MHFFVNAPNSVVNINHIERAIYSENFRWKFSSMTFVYLTIFFYSIYSKSFIPLFKKIFFTINNIFINLLKKWIVFFYNFV